MSDEVPDSAGGAVRAFLGALGFIVALIGAEMVAEKGGDRIPIGLVLIAASLPVFLSAVMWKWFRQRAGKLFADRLVAIANDPRWWIISFFLALFSMRLVMFGADFPWITTGIIVALMCLIAWGYFATRNSTAPAAPSNASTVPPKDPQTERDTLLLLNLAVDQTTLAMLENLIAQAPKGLSKDPLQFEDQSEPTLEERREYVSMVGRKLGYGTHRHMSFTNIVRDAEHDAERAVESVHPEHRSGDPLVLRKHAIAHLQCYRTFQFLRSQLREKEQEILRQRDGLIERLNARNNPRGA